jgi:glutamate racemase
MVHRPTILVFDSGLGGLSVFEQAVLARPDAHFVYVADDAVFPYGRLSEDDLVARVNGVMERVIDYYAPDCVIIACNTASTLVLPHLRARYPHLPFVGTVPAIKPAAERSHTGVISVLATPGTVVRDYTKALVRDHAAHCAVTLVGANQLASLAEHILRGQKTNERAIAQEIAQEIAPCFVHSATGAKTDVVVLACTHYPLILDQLRLAAPWPVEWIDSASAIARRMVHLLKDRFGPPMLLHSTPSRPETLYPAMFTRGQPVDAALAAVLARYHCQAGEENLFPHNS